ncbi:TPA: hypothetical protein DEP21_06350 [Patescibacteria group bacterium]|nr:hypothetical protein [Candidatus Gracilibacteria bacterium]
MGISTSGFCITNDEMVSVASLQEIRRRRGRYQEVVDRGEGDVQWIEKCNEIETKCLEYIKAKGYDENIKLD